MGLESLLSKGNVVMALNMFLKMKPLPISMGIVRMLLMALT